MIEIKAIYALQIIRRMKKSARMQMQSHSNVSILRADTFCHMKVREFEGLMRKFLIISFGSTSSSSPIYANDSYRRRFHPSRSLAETVSYLDI